MHGTVRDFADKREQIAVPPLMVRLANPRARTAIAVGEVVGRGIRHANDGRVREGAQLTSRAKAAAETHLLRREAYIRAPGERLHGQNADAPGNGEQQSAPPELVARYEGLGRDRGERDQEPVGFGQDQRVRRREKVEKVGVSLVYKSSSLSRR
jgi:hypothetical protein